jgi:hypothetical protein
MKTYVLLSLQILDSGCSMLDNKMSYAPDSKHHILSGAV